MALSFPISPTPGQTYTYSGRTWVWTGSAWKVNDTGAINGIIIGNTTPAAGLFTTLTANGEVNLGNVGNITILGGTSGQVLSTDGAGNLSWADGGGGSNVTSIVVDNFTGNGVANSFVLTTTPISEDWVSVNYNGVMQQTDAYSVSGNTITFVTTPANTAAIEIRTVTFGANLAVPPVLTVSSQGNLAVSNVSGLNFTGSGVTVTGSAGNANINIDTANANTANTAVTVTGNAQANITSVGTLTSLTVSGNITVSGTGSRIVGDFTSAANNRLAFQTSTANSLSIVAALPSGTGTTSILRAYCGSTPSTASFLDIRATSTATQLWSGREISSTFGFLPLTFHTNNAEQMRLDTSGNLGVGTNAPSQRLDVNGNVAITGSARRIIGDFSDATFSNRLLFQTSVANTNTIVGAVPSGTGQIAGFRVFNSSDSVNASFATLACNATVAYIDSSLSGTGSYLPLAFFTGGSERMRITSGGALAVGTATALGGLTVRNDGVAAALQMATNTNSTNLTFYQSNGDNMGGIYAYASGYAGGSLFGVGASGLALTQLANAPLAVGTSGVAQPLIFGTNSAERARIDSNGNMGVGATSLFAKFTVATTAGENIELSTANATFNGGVLEYVNRNSAETRPDMNFYIGTTGAHKFYTSGVERVRIDSAGQVGIGASSPTRQLTIRNTAAYMDFSATSFRRYTIGSETYGFIVYDDTASAYRMVVDANGYLLVGYTSSVGAYRLQVNGSVYISGTLTEASTIRSKTNVRPITGALSLVNQLQGVLYDHLDGTTQDEPGLIAEHTAQVVDNLVVYDESGQPMGVKYTKTVAYLIEAVKELTARVQTLEGK